MKLLPKRLARLVALARVVARRIEEDNGLQIASSLTFTTLLSLVPIVTVALTLVSALPLSRGWSGVIEDWVFDNLLPASAESIAKYAAQFVDNAANLTVVGLVFLAVTSIMLLLTMEDAFNNIWRVRRARPLLQRVLIYGALIAVGPLLVGASLSLSSWLMGASAGWTQDIPHADGVLIKCSAVALTSLALALLYYAMPYRPVKITDALTGGILAGVVFELTKHGFGLYITHFPAYELVYGAFAAVPVFLLWLYLSWLVVLLGAVVVATLPEWRQETLHGRLAPGTNYLFALQVLRVLWQAQQSGSVVTVSQLHAALRIRYERIEALLDAMHSAAWVKRASASGWVLGASPASIAVADVYKRFVFDPDLPLAAGEQVELASRARDFGKRIGTDVQMSVADLFAADRVADTQART
jgi:membrane protein